MPVGPGPGNFWNNILSTVFLLILLTFVYSYLVERQAKPDQLSISEIATQVKAGEIKEIIVRGDTLEVSYTDVTRTAGEAKKETDASITETLANLGVSTDQISGVTIDVQNQTGFAYWLGNLAPFLFPLLLLGFIVYFFSRSVKGAGMQALNFGSSKARVIDPNDATQKVTFKDVAGAKEAKQELEEIVDFLRNPKKFLDIGAEIPKGVMMMGAPGTGKTLLARAVAGEAGVPFFSISGSEFVEMFVGVGASRVRDLFQMAKKAAPAIIFVDEIDAVGRVRGTGVGGGNDEREQTLNQILVEMDGFEPTQKVIVMAATNRPDVLDPALLRPGRFDRRVTIDLPDRDDRKEILAIHARKKPLAEDVNLEVIAQRTPGFSGADLYSLMNEAAILAAREARKKVAQFDMIRSIEKVMLGPERKSHVLSKREREVTAYHEAGHALVASVLPYADPVQKISIISRGRAAGYTLKLPDEDRRMHSKKEFIDDIAMTLGGYVTEQMIFDDLTTGPSNDLQVIANLARDMVTKYGMSEKLGPVALEGSRGSLIGGGHGDDRGYSPEVARAIDEEVSLLIENGKQTARDILTKYRSALDAIAKKLVEVETLEREEYEAILKQEGVPINDVYRDMRLEEERIGDPTKAIEFDADHMKEGGK
ncbi:ATP-dependent zinc metalloprotease FtsH [Candidatus Parcubacteria bacterium]|uniref:ATP-dependent zinc metalloprotease FtsH n=1 Tax=Candidatus Kaiserbacteria bacterium CG10_big_fil_rev_8_21_14_0_10_47_16 TaxID=1974608 RepID=A0A2H0UE17_9BACT|nr:ATP-dependent zinc metalloprotease FtsH [Candidatus Parcubacteria bacterium]PIR84664.1 MAG: cell division protein FtsH [Candidatus Kaiserbacteria bacterium CG10_big_fil_rev_8_21_14_0_10_47_16]